MLAGIYDVLGRAQEAVETERQALNLAIEQNNQALGKPPESSKK